MHDLAYNVLPTALTDRTGILAWDQHYRLTYPAKSQETSKRRSKRLAADRGKATTEGQPASKSASGEGTSENVAQATIEAFECDVKVFSLKDYVDRPSIGDLWLSEEPQVESL